MNESLNESLMNQQMKTLNGRINETLMNLSTEE